MKLLLGTYRPRVALLHLVGPRSGPLARLLRYPNPFDAPWRRGVLDVYRAGGLGDVLMCTPALREIKRKNPGCRIRFYTNFVPLIRGLPFIEEALPADAAPRGFIKPGYEDFTFLRKGDTGPPRAHLARLLGDSLGINVRDTRPDCIIPSALVDRFRKAWRNLPRPHITVNRRASKFTPNKDWPDSYWAELVDHLARSAGVVEIGEPDETTPKVTGHNYVDLRGRTSLEELVAAVAAADIHVGPCSGPVHIAAAARKPSVVIYGGYEHPSNTMYPGNVALYTPVACAPCWMREPCPYNRKCLSAIWPAQVERAVSQMVKHDSAK